MEKRAAGPAGAPPGAEQPAIDVNGAVAILFDRLGPYHLARLRAAAQVLPVLALELCGKSREYRWDAMEDREISRRTLFPERDSASVGSREMHREVFATLDAGMPAAVAVPGWAAAGALAALDWCRRRGRPAIIMSESTAWDEPRRPWKEAVKRRLVGGWGSAGLVGGTAHADYLVQLGMPRDRVFLGYDAVDNAYFERGAAEARAAGEPLRERLGLPTRFFLASNRFIEKKNLPRLLTAYAEYRREAGAAAWSLVLLGDGPMREALVRQRSELGLETHLHLPGFQQYGELPAYYALAGGFIHASTTEQWGLVVNEAMASGLPVLVSARCGCARDLVTEGAQGWTFDPTDTVAITQAMLRLAALTDEARAVMGQAARVRIAGWSPEMFGDGLRRAVQTARKQPRRGGGVVDHLLIRLSLRR